MNEVDLIASRRLRPPVGEGYWVFAYGSLMWRPGFRCLESRPALLRGYHRAFCIYSVLYRGSPERPGLVLGLDRGGSCRGRVLRVAAEDGEAVARYLHEREMVTGVYEPRWLPVEIEAEGGGRRRIEAVTYVADRGHPQYTGRLSPERIVEMILAGEGVAGSNRAYLENTVCHLDELGIADCALHELLRLVEAKAGASRDSSRAPAAREARRGGESAGEEREC